MAQMDLARRSRNQRGPSRIKQEGREDRGEVRSTRFPNSPIFLFKILPEMSDSRVQQYKRRKKTNPPSGRGRVLP